MVANASFAAAPRLRRVPLLTAAFRPFFLAAAIWSAAALALWIGVLAGSVGLPSRFDPLSWHIHEMLFGFVLAAIAGFLLTAIANWTGRPPVAGTPLLLLAALWLAGRAACLLSALCPGWFGVAADLAFPVALTLVAARELIAGGNRRNYPLLAPLVLLAVADLLTHLTALGLDVPIGLGWRLAMFCVVVLLSVIAGRIVPAFTRNWLRASGRLHTPPETALLDRVALGALHLGLLLWVFVPDSPAIGAVLVVGGMLHLWRLARWCGFATMREPLLLVLHLGCLWLALGTLLLGLSSLSAAVPPAAGIHALTAGAFGTMILGVMARATLGHTGRALHADGATVTMFGLVTLAGVLRLAAAWPDAWTLYLLEASAAAWVAAFALFVAHYGPMLVRPRVAQAGVAQGGVPGWCRQAGVAQRGGV